MKVTPLSLHKIAAVLGVMALISVGGLAGLYSTAERYDLQPIANPVCLNAKSINLEIVEPLPLPTEKEVIGQDLLLPEPIPVLPVVKKNLQKKIRKH